MTEILTIKISIFHRTKLYVVSHMCVPNI